MHLRMVLSCVLFIFLLNICSIALADTVHRSDYKPEFTPVMVDFYFFHSRTCSHCRKAKPFIESLPIRYSWLNLKSYELSSDAKGRELYIKMAKELGGNAGAVPAFIFCGEMQTGYLNDEATGKSIENKLLACYDKKLKASQTAGSGVKEAGDESDIPAEAASGSDKQITVPVLDVDANEFALPVMTVIIAGMDAFNPCAFFVLLFLLSLLVHARSKKRMLGIGLLFVFFSGAIYFVFMAALLNVIELLDEIRWVTIIAGLIAVVMALINIKDYFWFKKGVSLSIPEGAKPSLYQRMRKLINAANLWAMIGSTIVLAIAANSYELLCTTGFPLIYNTILMSNGVSGLAKYSYLVFYNTVYIIPLMVIVIVFVSNFNSRKLKESEGQVLKLMSGFMMVALGLMLLFWPDGLNHIEVALGAMTGAIVLTFIVVKLKKRFSVSK